MRVIDRDLIRGGHYGQRPCVPHSKAEHMAAPTNAAANVKKALANSEPSTHGTKRRSNGCRRMTIIGISAAARSRRPSDRARRRCLLMTAHAAFTKLGRPGGGTQSPAGA